MRNNTRVSNSLDPDQAQHIVISNCLQNLSADNTSRQRVMAHISFFPASKDLLITFANRLDPDQAQQRVGPDLDPHC